jgi:dUTP pyrophosphatase
MKVKIKKLHPDAQIPKYAHLGDSGFDLVAIEDVSFNGGETRLVRTGLAISVGSGYELQVRPRSGLSLKTPLRVANSPGTVDSSYLGEICVIVTNTDPPLDSRYSSRYIKKGDRIAQGVVCPVERVEFEEVESLDETERGDGAFGSTGV